MIMGPIRFRILTIYDNPYTLQREWIDTDGNLIGYITADILKYKYSSSCEWGHPLFENSHKIKWDPGRGRSELYFSS